MRIYNSATHKKEEFQPIESGKVRMYVCGPTVYDNIHIGNARTFISFDVIRRWLIASGYEVTFAQNLTDVDDKIIKRANEQGRTAAEVATEFSNKFIGVMRAANVLDPDVRPRATKEIGPMIAMIKTLIEQGHAYAADNGDVLWTYNRRVVFWTVGLHQVDACEEFIGGIGPHQALARYTHKIGQSGAAANKDRLKAHFKELVYRKNFSNDQVSINGNAAVPQSLNFLLYNLLRQAKLRDSIHQHTTGCMQRFKNCHTIALGCQVPGTGKTRRARTNDGYPVAV